MERYEVFQILGIEETKDERAIKSAYREKLAVTNPEDHPEGFKRLRAAYEEACRLAGQPDGESGETVYRDDSPSGLWVEKAAEIYRKLSLRRKTEEWKKLFDDDCFLSLEEEENCRVKLLRFMMDHFRLPGDVWKLMDKKLCLTRDAAGLREKFPADFVRYILSKCERGEDVEFDQFEGEDEAQYDLFLQYYDRCWQALQEDNLEQAELNIGSADGLGIRHPVMEICRAELLCRQGKTKEAIALLEAQLEKYPRDVMLCFNTAETLWKQGDAEDIRYRQRASEIYKVLKEDNDTHYMANLRLTEWYCDNGQYREAKKCAEKVLYAGGGEEFMKLLARINVEIEKELEEKWRSESDCLAALELCWCYLQDGKVARGISLALRIEKRLPEDREAEWNGLMSKLYVEEAEYGTAVEMTRFWEKSLEKKMLAGESDEEKDRDRDRLKQAHMIRMQCFYNLGFRDRKKFAEAVREGEAVLEGSAKDIGILLEMAQTYTELEEYEKVEEIVERLVEDYQVYAAYAVSLEACRRQLDAGGVIRAGSLCIRHFPTFVKPYEYMAKVYLDLERAEDFDKLLEDAKKNGVKSAVLEAYDYQRTHKQIELEILNNKLKAFRREFRKPLEEGKQVFYEAGLSQLTEYLYHCPDSYMFVERGIFHRAAHHYEEAREDFEKAISLNPANSYALNGLSFVYRYTGDFEKALFYIKKAILYMDRDMSPVIYSDMADLYSLMGEYEMALTACRQYEEAAKNRSVWFLNQLAECHVNLGKAEEACKVYEEYAGRNQWESFSKRVDACIKCGNCESARGLLRDWSAALGLKKGIGQIFSGGKESGGNKKEAVGYYKMELWTEMVFGNRADVMSCVKRLMRLPDNFEDSEGKLADVIFACIACGSEKEGRKYGRQLKKWLQQEQFSEKYKYYNREKGHLQLEILAAWYTEKEEKLQEMLDSEGERRICHFCTSAVCRELEGVRVLFLNRQGRREEAKERLRRSLEVQPADEYMLAIKHLVFQENV